MNTKELANEYEKYAKAVSGASPEIRLEMRRDYMARKLDAPLILAVLDGIDAGKDTPAIVNDMLIAVGREPLEPSFGDTLGDFLEAK